MLALIQFGPAALGMVIALSVWIVRRRAWPELPSPSPLWTAIGLLVALGCAILFTAWRVFPLWMPWVGADGGLMVDLLTFTLPLVLCVIAQLCLLPPVRRAEAVRAAELSPRRLTTFVPRSWGFVAAAVLVAVIVVTVSAGLLSSADEAGRYLMYSVDASTNTGGSTTIYGWFYSVPCMVAIGVIVALALLQLGLIARPPLSAERDEDVAQRMARARNVLAVVTGGLLLHLGAVLLSLHGTSSLRIGFASDDAGWVELGTAFADLAPLLLTVGYVSTVGGFALWGITLLSAVPARKRQAASVLA